MTVAEFLVELEGEHNEEAGVVMMVVGELVRMELADFDVVNVAVTRRVVIDREIRWIVSLLGKSEPHCEPSTVNKYLDQS